MKRHNYPILCLKIDLSWKNKPFTHILTHLRTFSLIWIDFMALLIRWIIIRPLYLEKGNFLSQPFIRYTIPIHRRIQMYSLVQCISGQQHPDCQSGPKWFAFVYDCEPSDSCGDSLQKMDWSQSSMAVSFIGNGARLHYICLNFDHNRNCYW